MAASTGLEGARNGSLEFTAIPDAGYCAVKPGCDFLKLDQVIEEAVPELIDVDERNRLSALGT